jgi:hypothetical protein
MANGSGRFGASAAARRSGPRLPRLLAALALVALAGCNEFDSAHVAQVCLRSAMKAGEPFGNQREREQTEAQLRHYCQTAAEGR